ncbi:MAG: S-layer homology domain-containing protein [Oscillospiraceae bacterium]|jgi:hypothetical protein|nr:S-layer homology domain-containing protein [Oscillospiraceae bacterium]
MKKKWVILSIAVLALLLASLAVLMIVRANAPKKVWYADSVDYVIERGLMEGDGVRGFNPAGRLTRERLAVVLWRLCGQPAPPDPEEIFFDFDPGKPSSWAKDAIYWALGYYIVMPIMVEFNPNLPPGGIMWYFDGQSTATREQFVEALFRFARYSGVASSKRTEFDFLEENVWDSWAVEAIQWCAEEGLLEIYSEGDTLLPSPQKRVTRAEVAVIIARFCEIYDAAAAQP